MISLIALGIGFVSLCVACYFQGKLVAYRDMSSKINKTVKDFEAKQKEYGRRELI